MKKTGFIVILLITLTAVSWGKERVIEISAKKFSYTPHIVKVDRGDEVTIRLISEDVTHGLYLDGYGNETRAHPGQDGSITFIADKTGRYNFRCSVTCGEFHPFMVGYLVVRPNSRFLLFTILVGAAGLASLAVTLIARKRG